MPYSAPISGTGPNRSIDVEAHNAAVNDAIAEAVAAIPPQTSPIVSGRPGQQTRAFVTAAVGAPADLTPIEGQAGITSANIAGLGAVARVDNTPAIIAVREALAVQRGRVYRVHAYVRRLADGADPAGNSVVLQLARLNASYGLIGVTTIDARVLRVSDGLWHLTGTVAVNPGALPEVDYELPEGTVYVRPYVQVYTADHQTAVAQVEVIDITEAAQIEGGLEVAAVAQAVAIAEAEAVAAAADRAQTALSLAAAQNAAAIALAGSPYRLPLFAQLAARLRYSGATGDQINVVAGDVVDVPGVGSFSVLASGASASNLDYTGTGGVKLSIIAAPLVTLDQFGGGVSASGAENSAALVRIWNRFSETGCRIALAGGKHFFNPVELGRTTRTISFEGAMRTTYFAHPAPYVLSDASLSLPWLIKIGNDLQPSYVAFRGVMIEGPVAGERATFNGIYVMQSNDLVVSDCHGRLVDGCAWRFDRPHNSKIDVKTIRCGNETHEVPAVLITGSVGSADTFFGNDVLLTGTTEQDHLGWHVEHVVNLRAESSMKIHGGPDTFRALHLHRVRNAHMFVMATQQFSAQSLILVSDGNGGETSYVTDPGSGRMRNQVALGLTVEPIPSLISANANGAVVAYKLGNALSRVKLSGVLYPVDAPTNLHLAAILGTGTVGTQYDFSDIRGTWNAGLIIDERTVNPRPRVMARPITTEIAIAADPSIQNSNRKIPGLLTMYDSDGNGIAPPIASLGFTRASASNGSVHFVAAQSLFANVSGAISASRDLIRGARLHLPESDGGQCTGHITRIMVGVSGVPDPTSDTDYWALQLNRGNTAVRTLKLTRSALSAAAGDGLPSAASATGVSGVQAFDFSQGIGSAIWFRTQFLFLSLVKVGSPPDLADLNVTVVYEARA